MVTYTPAKTADKVPIVDLKDTFSDDDDGRRAAAAILRGAARDTGFFYVINHGIESSLIDRAFAQSKRFFSQPAEWKGKWRKQPGTNGYEPQESQVLDPTSPPDLKESFNFTKPALAGTPDDTKNLWPNDFPGFREDLEDYRNRVQGLALHISRLIAISLYMPATFFDSTFENQEAALRLLRYPPMPRSAKANQLGAGAHTDWGWITLLTQDQNGGLEVETATRGWITVDPIPGAFVVNLGDLVPAWSNGLYHSSLHRVLNKRPDVDRYSIVLFYNHRYETVVETLPTCLKPGETPQQPFVSGDHRRQKYLASRRHLLERRV
jgi:isopenicillin N synthase-like dioxygenase